MRPYAYVKDREKSKGRKEEKGVRKVGKREEETWLREV